MSLCEGDCVLNLLMESGSNCNMILSFAHSESAQFNKHCSCSESAETFWKHSQKLGILLRQWSLLDKVQV